MLFEKKGEERKSDETPVFMSKNRTATELNTSNYWVQKLINAGLLETVDVDGQQMITRRSARSLAETYG